MKRYHVYSEDELKEKCFEPTDVPKGREEYMMILETWRSGPCGGCVRGTVAYPNMFHALGYIRQELKEIEGFMKPEEAEKRFSAIDDAMNQIRNKKSDEGMDFPEVGADLPGTGVMFYAPGYWDDGVLKIIEYIKKDNVYIEYILEDNCEEKFIESEDQYLESQDEENNELEEDFEARAREIADAFDIGSFMKGKDIYSDEFFNQFIELCNDYNDKLNA